MVAPLLNEDVTERSEPGFVSAIPGTRVTADHVRVSRPVRSPAVVPLPVAQHSWALGSPDAEGDLAPWLDIELPSELRRAIPRRQRQFRAGRFCALEALRMLVPARTFTSPGRAAGGAPVWPEGMTGSITHTDDFTSAAVAHATDVAAIGIDSEQVVSNARARAVVSVVSQPVELERAREAGCDTAQALTLVFSAKESIFKCLHPLVGVWIGFHDVRIAGIDGRARTFDAVVVNALSDQIPAGTVLRGQFELDATHVHTGIVLSGDTTPGVVFGGRR